MKKLIIGLLAAVTILSSPTIVQANQTEPDGIDIMIVIDMSDSINWNDPQRELLEAVYQLLNLSIETGNRIGFVAYNDTIVAYQGLREIVTTTDIEEMMEHLRRLHASRGTDIGLALQTARRQLQLDQYRVGQTAIIFLSDGWYEFALFNLNRNHDDVMADVEYVLETVTYPIFSLEYRIPTHQNSRSDNEWKQRADGVSLTVHTSDDRFAAINEIYQLILKMATNNEDLPVIDKVSIYEHQLMFEIPGLGDGYYEVIEFIVTGDGTFDTITVPSGYEHITVEKIGNDFFVTINNPQQKYYILSYFSEAATMDASVVVSFVEPEPGIPWVLIGIATSVTVALMSLILLILRIRKKQLVKKLYPNLSGMLECDFIEIPTGMNPVPIQAWSASVLAVNSKTSLSKLLKNVPLSSKMPESEKIFVSINLDNTISITNLAGVVCFQNGKVVKEQQIDLQNHQGLYMVFQKGTLEIELSVRQTQA